MARIQRTTSTAAVVAMLAIALASGTRDAAAQGAGPYYDDESVVVDLSVIDDGGRGRRPLVLPPAGVVPGYGGPLRMPGTEMPRSRFHGPGGAAAEAKAAPKPPTAAKSQPVTKMAAAPAEKPAPEKRATEKRAPVEKRAAAPARGAPSSARGDSPAQPATPPPPPAGIPAAPPPPPVLAAVPPPSPPAPTPAPAAAPTPTPSAPPPTAITPPPPATPAPAAPAPVAAAPATPAPMAPAAQPPAPPSVAAVPLAPTAPAKDRALQIAFPAGDSRVPAAAQAGLKELAERMKAQESLRLQIVAYAAGGDLTASEARRLSLSRALAVRTVLIEQGIRSTRIDVRALGDKVTDQPANRVDLSFGDR